MQEILRKNKGTAIPFYRTFSVYLEELKKKTWELKHDEKNLDKLLKQGYNCLSEFMRNVYMLQRYTFGYL